MWYLKLFEKGTDYEAFKGGGDWLTPNVSYAIDTMNVYYTSNNVEEWYSNYMTIEALEDGLTATFNMTEGNESVEYCIDNGDWISISSGEETPSINQGQMIAFKGILTPMMDYDNWILGIGTFSISKECNLKGNCMSLLFGDDAKNHDSLEGYDEAFSSLFYECTTIKNVDSKFLHATTLSEGCYSGMFCCCESLTTASKLPATELAASAYTYMFQGCTSLVTAPELPATTLAQSCYEGMFYGCTSLTQAPELPATTLAEGCYYAMFQDCTSLVTAPELPATTLASDCYQCMFDNCTSLTESPILPAEILAPFCYFHMFWGCVSLNKITMLAKDISANECMTMWTGMLDDNDNEVSAVSPIGTFIKHPDMTSLPIGTQENRYSGIPEGWEVKDNITLTECTNLTITADDVIGNATTTTIHYTAICNGIYKGDTVTGFVKKGTAVSTEFPQNTSETETVERTITFEFMGVTASTVITQGVYIPYEKYLTFETIEDSTFKLTSNSCEYSLDEGETWVSLEAKTDTPTVSAGSKIMFKATNPSISTYHGIGRFSSTGKFNISGNIMSMLYGDDFVDKNDLNGKDNVFNNLFAGCTNVVEAHRLILPATTLGYGCYNSMFYGCTSLITAPELPATKLANDCYFCMFMGCTSLVTTTELPANTLYQSCYHAMFSNCSSLVTAPELPATTLARGCYYSMFSNCSSLVTAPELSATTLAGGCYTNMFSGCSKLVTAPELPATTLATQCYSSMFQDCTSLVTAPTLPATTLAEGCYYSMFQNCTSLVNAPELPATTLAYNCYYYMFADCSKLNNITMLATDISANYCLSNWVSGVASIGTFIKHPDMASLSIGVDGIPEGWEVKDADISKPIITFTVDGVQYHALDGTCWTEWIYTDYNVNAFTDLGLGFDYLYVYIREEESGYRETAYLTYNGNGFNTWDAIINGGEYAIRYGNSGQSSGSGFLPFTFNINGNGSFTYIEGQTWKDYIDSGAEGFSYDNTNVMYNGTKLMGAQHYIKPNQRILQSVYYNLDSSNDVEEWYSNYMTIEALEDGLTATFNFTSINGDEIVEYCIDNGDWVSISSGEETPSINQGQMISFRSNLKGTFDYDFGRPNGIGKFEINKKCKLKGNCTSLLYGDEAKLHSSLEDNIGPFYELFYGCSNIIEVEETFLPSTEVSWFAYGNMFYNCTSLVKSPELPATILGTFCYNNMFSGCTSLVTAPELPATTLVGQCYAGMFQGCTSLNNITMLATDISAMNCLYNWVSNVASSGTFTKAASMTSLPSGENGIPSGWTVQDYVE